MANNFRNGFWAIYPLRFLNYVPVSIRHFIPLAFTLGLSGILLLSMLNPIFIYVLAVLTLIYFSAAVFFSAKNLPSYKMYYLVLCPFIFLLLHLSYGLGSMWASIRVVLKS